MTPEISIIVPAFNEEKYISRCLDSILSQTYSDFEVLCIDDGSTDSTYKIITEYSEKDSRIIPLKNRGKGVSDARNFGVENSNGKYIGFVDSDDFIQPQMFEFLHKTIINENADMAICGCKRTGIQENKSFEYSCNRCTCKDLINSGKIDSFLCIYTKLIKSEFIKNKISFDKFRIGEDTLFSSKLWTSVNNVYFVDLPLYNYFTNPDGVFSSNLSSEKWLDQLNTHYMAYQNFKKIGDSFTSHWFLENGMKFLLSYKMFADNSDKIKSEIKALYKKYFKEYRKNKSISLFNKIYVFISYHFSLLYKIRRKMKDKTIK